MNRLYLDTEFNSFQGELMSIALAPGDKSKAAFYRVVEGSWQHPRQMHEWVTRHVAPHLYTYGGQTEPVSREQAARDLASYLRLSTPTPVIVADWPTDFSQLLDLLILGPGQMVGAPDFDMAYRSLRGFNTADHSVVPHNALADAEALRDYVESNLA
jgi:hypothetical protein